MTTTNRLPSCSTVLNNGNDTWVFIDLGNDVSIRMATRGYEVDTLNRANVIVRPRCEVLRIIDGLLERGYVKGTIPFTDYATIPLATVIRRHVTDRNTVSAIRLAMLREGYEAAFALIGDNDALRAELAVYAIRNEIPATI